MSWQPDYVTSSALSGYLGIDDLDDDPEAALAVTAASRAIDDATNRQYGKVDAPEARTYYARPDYKTCASWSWIVDVDDYQTATGLVVTVDGVAVTTFLKEPVNAAQRGRPWTRVAFTIDSEALPTTHPHQVDVTALWGWTAFPGQVPPAALLQAARFFKRKDAPFGVAGSPDIGSELRLLAKVDPDVAVMLRGLIRPRAVG